MIYDTVSFFQLYTRLVSHQYSFCQKFQFLRYYIWYLFLAIDRPHFIPSFVFERCIFLFVRCFPPAVMKLIFSFLLLSPFLFTLLYVKLLFLKIAQTFNS